MRYRRSILSPAQWRLTADDLPRAADPIAWRSALTEWRERWQCPAVVELREDDRRLRLDFDVPLHAALAQAHLRRYGTAVLTESADTADDLGWVGQHAHEIALPLVAARPPAPNPLTGPLPVATNHGHGPPPVSPGARWLNAKIFTHPERVAELIAEYLPDLLAELGENVPYWFVRYRSAHETDHLRLRIRTWDSQSAAASAQLLAQWAYRLRDEQVAGPLACDAYYPEIGRYGAGAAMAAAEEVFAADSAAVAAQLRHFPASVLDPLALTAWGMADTVRSFLGPEQAMQWLLHQPVPVAKSAARAVADEAIHLAQPNALTTAPEQVAAAWRARSAALAAYAAVLPEGMDTDAVVESLLHMHHNRARGIDRDGEAVCRRLARQAAVAWRHRKGSPVP